MTFHALPSLELHSVMLGFPTAPSSAMSRRLKSAPCWNASLRGLARQRNRRESLREAAAREIHVALEGDRFRRRRRIEPDAAERQNLVGPFTAVCR